MHKLISITHEIAFDANPSLEAKGVFLDISKAFDSVWHKWLLYKIECMGKLLNLIKSFLFDRQQRVALNVQESDWMALKAGGTIISYIHITDSLESNVKLFAEDTSMFSAIHETVTTSVKLNKDLDNVAL